MRKLTVCQGCGVKYWVDKETMLMPKHNLRNKVDGRRVKCPMSEQKIEVDK